MALDSDTTTDHPPAVPPLLVIGGLVALELGAALAKLLFPLAGVAGVVFLRLLFAAVALLLCWRSKPPWERGTLGRILVIGTLLALHHLSFYAAVDRLPLGVAVTIEFAGPLAVALLMTKRAAGFLWAGLAACGVVLTATGDAHGTWPLGGILLAAGAAASWAAYILLSSALGRRTTDGRWLALATSWGALLILPVGLGTLGGRILDWRVLLGCLGVALLCEALSYSMQNEALRRMPAQSFAILISLEPAVAAVLGLVILGQAITAWQTAGILTVIAASIANTLSPGHRRAG